MKPIDLLYIHLLSLVIGILMPATDAETQGGSLQLCLAAAADYSPIYPTQTLPVGAANEIAAVVRLGEGESYTMMTATWSAVEVTATPKNHVIRKIDLQMQGKDRAAIRLSHPQGLLMGKYRLDLTADRKPWRAAEFTVAAMPAAPEVKQPKDLLPLAVGTVWRYAFEQQFAPHVRPKLPAGVKLDADGKLRATLTKTAVKIDDAGVHIETRRNDALVEEEWWQLTEAGLVVAQIKSGGDISSFDPPHPLWPWPLEVPREWFYEPPDKSFKQRFRMWGPVPTKGPTGEASGYVVLMEQPSPSIALSVERHYVPGTGMVREVVVQARNGVMLTRWENVLTSKP